MILEEDGETCTSKLHVPNILLILEYLQHVNIFLICFEMIDIVRDI